MRRLSVWLVLVLLGAVLAGCASRAARVQADLAPGEPAPVARACPNGLPEGTRCLSGTDAAGAQYLIAIPREWNQHLVLHVHGTPVLVGPRLSRTLDDLRRWAVLLRAGYAWAGSSFRQGGVAVLSAVEDTERLRRIFRKFVAQPQLTLLHGQSWGARVAARAAELFSATSNAGVPPYDALLLTSGALGSASQSEDFRLDLRVIYQHLCGNHPSAQDKPYPLWMGLPVDSGLTHEQLRARVNDCLGLQRPAAQRSAEQQTRVSTLVRVMGIPERAVLGHLEWATWHFQDIVLHRTRARNPFGNLGAQYRGCGDDAALNAQVVRYAADDEAVEWLNDDADTSGDIRIPVLSVHAVGDPMAFVELETSFRDTMAAAGRAQHLVQVFTDHSEHHYLADALYPALLQELAGWAQRGVKPSPESVRQACVATEARFGPGCRILPDYRSAPLSNRVPERRLR